MPTPANAPAAQTGPAATEKQNTALFSRFTERQELPQLKQTFPGLGERTSLELQKVGVISQIRLLLTLKYTVTGTEKGAVGNPGWPYNLIRRLQISANGVTGIISCSGYALEARKRRIFRNPVKSVDEGPEAGVEQAHGTAETVVMSVVIPVAHDMMSLIGSLLAQNEETALAIDIDWATEAEALHGNKIEKVEGTVEWATTVFSMGSAPIGNKRVTILPDLSAFHGIVEKSKKLVGTGEEPTPITRTVGQLLCFTCAILNGPEKAMQPTAWESFAIEYGANKKPRVWKPAKTLIAQNADDYDGAIEPGKLMQAVVDNEVDNPTRDMIYPEAMTELEATVGIKATETIETNAKTIVCNETLYPSR